MQVNLKPTQSSNINVELWLPLPKYWNNKFLGTGNGGGIICYSPLRYGLLRGFATANTDLRAASDVENLVNDLERQNDFDGITAGASGNNRTYLHAQFI